MHNHCISKTFQTCSNIFCVSVCTHSPMQAVIFHSKQVLVHFEYFSCNLQQKFFCLFYFTNRGKTCTSQVKTNVSQTFLQKKALEPKHWFFFHVKNKTAEFLKLLKRFTHQNKILYEMREHGVNNLVEVHL